MEEEENTMLMKMRRRKKRSKGYHGNDDYDHCKQEMDEND
jgi:hypothetical protein